MVANYHGNLSQVLALSKRVSLNPNIPLVVFNSDFENHYLANAEGEARAGLIAWREDGDRWMRSLCEGRSQCRLIKIEDQEHLLPFSHPEKLLAELLHLLAD
mgnify:CR=1 FL=1